MVLFEVASVKYFALKSLTWLGRRYGEALK